MKICFATNNKHKREEVQALLGPSFYIQSLQEIGCTEELAEEQPTIEGNSEQKARYIFDTYGIPCFADDSGLEVDALEGAPGVHSAYYAGPQRSFDDNMNLLLVNLKEKTNRRARFKTVITLVAEAGQWQFEGILKGTILDHKRGSGGFGYDPLFLPDGFEKTLAEMTLSEKNKISHRSRAIEKLVHFLNTNSILR